MKQLTYEPDEGRKVGLHNHLACSPASSTDASWTRSTPMARSARARSCTQGDPLVLAIHERKPQAGAAMLHRGGPKSYVHDDSLLWDHKGEGVVTDVHADEHGVIKSRSRATARWGSGTSCPDAMAIRAWSERRTRRPDAAQHRWPAAGRAAKPAGRDQRTNPMQVIEAVLGKIARQDRPALRPACLSGREHGQYALQSCEARPLGHRDNLRPAHQPHLPNVLTGERFFYKLYHTADTKETGRDTGAYTAEDQPAKGGAEGAKRLGLLDINALISHGVPAVLKDAKLIRGQRNDAFWNAFRTGQPAPMPEVPLVYHKWLAHLTGAGINVRRDGGRLHVMALTDKDIDQLSSGPLMHAQAVHAASNDPIPGGLFDVGLTGGHHGNRWSHLPLHESFPNPVMEEPVRRILGLTKVGLEDKLKAPGGLAELRQALEHYDVDRGIQVQRQAISSGRTSRRDAAVKLLGYLTTLKDKDIKPAELLLSKMPVIPPAFRPVTKIDGMQLTSDANVLYQDLHKANENLRDALSEGLDGGEERLALYRAMKAVSGLGDPISLKAQERKLGGLLTHVFGKGSPKFGLFQRRVLSNTLDVVGRAAITPDPSLDMDHVGIPESKAWEIYRPFVMRRLARRYNGGEQRVPMTEIARWILNKDSRAHHALLEEIAQRPVLINRAPVWHRYGFMAAWPHLVKGETLHISPITTPGFGADFDGDAMNYSVPVTDEAVAEATDKMLPSRNLLSVRDFKVHQLPRQEYLHGLYLATRPRGQGRAPRTFASVADVKRAYRNGELAADEPVVIAGGYD
jgi:hypothetical protein